MSHRSIPLCARLAMSVALVSMASCLRDKSHDGAAAGTVDTASPAAERWNGEAVERVAIPFRSLRSLPLPDRFSRLRRHIDGFEDPPIFRL